MTNAPSTIAAPADRAGVKTRRRPFGLFAIIVIQLLMVLLSAFLLGIAAFAVVMSGSVSDLAVQQVDLTYTDIGAMLLTLVVNAVCAFGLWRRQRWAWFLTMLQLGFFMLSDLYSYFTNSPPQTYVWSMLLNVFMVFYLNQRDVQAIFLNNDKEWQPR
jgi:uncharacterized membrane protein (DUF2068 family)